MPTQLPILLNRRATTAGASNTLAYTNKVLALSPLAYWPQAEASGNTVVDATANGRNGTYTSVTLGAVGIGDGRTAASYNGSTSFANVFSASLQGVFNGQSASLSGWAQHGPTWNSTTLREVLRFLVDGSNFFIIRKSATANTLEFLYTAGGTAKTITTAMTTNAWFHWALTVTKAGDALIAYVNGAQVGSTQTGLGSFTGSLAANTTLLACASQAPTEQWNGQLAHTAVFTGVLTPAQIATLAVVP